MSYIILLMTAAYEGEANVVAYLLANQFSNASTYLDQADERGNTPLMAAARANADGSKEVVELLLAAGADPSIPNEYTLWTAQDIAEKVLAEGLSAGFISPNQELTLRKIIMDLKRRSKRLPFERLMMERGFKKRS